METSLSTNLGNYGPSNSMGGSFGSLQAERTGVSSVSSSKSMDVQLVTAEGDKVTISLDARAASLYGVNEKTEMDGDSVSYRKTELSASLYEREMTFTVEGDLNAAERRDIRKALKTLDRMMNHMMHGNLQPMSANAKRLQGLDTISALEATMSYERTMMVAEQTSAASVTGSAPAQKQPIEQATTPAASVSPIPATAAGADDIGNVLVRELKSSETPMERMMAFFDQLLDDYRQKMPESNTSGMAMIDRVAEKLRSALDQINASQSEAA